jgi:Mg/Co/Ni transporter MgtE
VSELAPPDRPASPADIALVLENLPLDRRLQLWAWWTPRRGPVLLEVSDAVREGLIEAMGEPRSSMRPGTWRPTSWPS